MGMFDDEAKKMAQEAAAEVNRQELKKVELNGVAQDVWNDLKSYLADRQLGQSFVLEVHQNLVSLRKRTTSNTMDIKCTEDDVFELALDGKPAASCDRSQMIRGVMQWLER